MCWHTYIIYANQFDKEFWGLVGSVLLGTPPAHSTLRLLLCCFGRKWCWSKRISCGQLRSPGSQRGKGDRARYGLPVGLRNHFVSSDGLDVETRPIFRAVVTGVLGQGLRTERPTVRHRAQHAFLRAGLGWAALTGFRLHGWRRAVLLCCSHRRRKVAQQTKAGRILQPCWWPGDHRIQALERRGGSVLDISCWAEEHVRFLGHAVRQQLLHALLFGERGSEEHICFLWVSESCTALGDERSFGEDVCLIGCFPGAAERSCGKDIRFVKNLPRLRLEGREWRLCGLRVGVLLPGNVPPLPGPGLQEAHTRPATFLLLFRIQQQRPGATAIQNVPFMVCPLTFATVEGAVAWRAITCGIVKLSIGLRFHLWLSLVQSKPIAGSGTFAEIERYSWKQGRIPLQT